MGYGGASTRVDGELCALEVGQSTCKRRRELAAGKTLASAKNATRRIVVSGSIGGLEGHQSGRIAAKIELCELIRHERAFLKPVLS